MMERGPYRSPPTENDPVEAHPHKGKGELWRTAGRLALHERRLWAAALLVSVGLSECWRVLFGWGPQWVGERVAERVRVGAGKGFQDTALLVLTGLGVFLLLRAMGYLGETVLVSQVAFPRRGQGKVPAPALRGEGGATVPEEGTVLAFREALRQGGGRCFRLALALLPWDAARVAVVTLASLMVLLWGRWDPHLRFIAPYLLALLLWFLLLLAVYVLLGIPAYLAARQVVINGKSVPEGWREGLSLFLGRTEGCLQVWLQALSADAAFLALAWPLSFFLAWTAGRAAETLRPPALAWLVRVPLYGLLAVALVLGQAVVQAFKSSLWTTFFLSVTATPPVVS
ncbi:hypothetical protein [Candidatus Solincola tengchongensis]|uniref:hypothetical protein n=1 Tax=Candidatus Solincola tengchongensis TaxID=2900693 RepID=UPI0025810E13|nr:hypothetical protein [Candidatus Solincola tengchongensis]